MTNVPHSLEEVTFVRQSWCWCHVKWSWHYCTLLSCHLGVFKTFNLRRWGQSFTVFEEGVCEHTFLWVWVEHDQTCSRALNGSTPKLPNPPRPQPPLPWDTWHKTAWAQNFKGFWKNFMQYGCYSKVNLQMASSLPTWHVGGLGCISCTRGCIFTHWQN